MARGQGEMGQRDLLFENDPQYLFYIAAVTPARDAGQCIGS